MSTKTRPRPVGTERPHDAAPTRRGARTAVGALGALFIAGAWFLPLWQATLLAPQYPGGLSMQAYGHKVTGDVAEIDTLNHYVGMRAFDPADIPEMGLWPLVLVLGVVAVAVAAWRRTGWASRVAKLYLWATPVGVLAVIQFRLHQYGHDLEPLAALRIEPFTPWVIGPTKVWNFTTWSRPGLGLVSFVLAAVVVTFGPRVRDWLQSRRVSPAVAAALLMAPVLLGAAPADDHGAHEHDHGAPSAPTIATVPGEPVVPDAGPVVVEHPHAGDLASLLSEVEDGGTLALPPGTYHGPVVIDRPMTIEGQGLPLVVGDGTGSVVTVTAPGTVVRGIAVRGTGPGPTGNPAAIRVEADDVRVEQTVVEDAYMGIALAGVSRVAIVDNVVRGRAHASIGDDSHATEHDVSASGADAPAVDGHATHDTAPAGDSSPHMAGQGDHAGHPAHDAGLAGDRGDGIWLHDTTDVLVQGNLVEDTRDGIYTVFGDHTLIDSNHVRRGRYAVHSMYADNLVVAANRFDGNFSGAVLMYGGGVVALKNTITKSHSTSTGFGILLKDVADVRATQNVLADNRVGLHLDGPAGEETQTFLAANTIARNQIGAAIYSSARAAFRMNSFVDNLVQVMPKGGALYGVSWIDEGVGNYWSTYRGHEAAGEPGRGAISHVEGGAVDRLLLRSPELVAIADSPAMRLLRSIEERWGARIPVATDTVPLTRPVSPPVPDDGGPRAGTPVGVAVASLLLVPSALVLWHPRRPRPRLWRSPRVVTTS